MFGVYSREAGRILREVLSKAEESGGGGTVGPESIVSALLSGVVPREDLALRALDASGITAGAFSDWARRMEPEDAGAPSGRIFDAEMNLCLRRALQLALEEGGRVGTEHLLLGVLYERDSFAAIGLEKLGLTYEAARLTIRRENRNRPQVGVEDDTPILIPDAPQRTTRAAAIVAELARQVAEEDPAADGRLGTHHYLLAVAMEGETGHPGGLAGRVLRSFGLSYPVLLARAQELSAPERGGFGSDHPDLVSRPPESPVVIDEPPP